MFTRLVLLFNTVRYLKPVQLFYQVYYKLKAPFIPYIPYRKYARQEVIKLQWDCKALIVSGNKLKGKNEFIFLNLHHSFKDTVDWKFSGHGKLWNYNLQYFDYLHDDQVTDEIKESLVEDFSQQILAGKIKLEPYPVSLRLINWLLFYSKTNYGSNAFFKALRYQVHYLECNLEYHILANHYLENLISLCIASIGLKNERLGRKVFPKLLLQLDEQLFKDGGHFERSPMYHCIILGKLLLLNEILLKNESSFSRADKIKAHLQTMCGWLKAFCYEDDTYELVNDSTNHIAPSPNQLFQVANSLGIQAVSVSLSDSGFRKYSGAGYEALVDVGNISPAYQPGHIHSGMLALNLRYQNKPVLVDMGISTYNNSPQRQMERSTAAHNTVVVYNKNQFQVWSSFRVARRAHVDISSETPGNINASHDGYRTDDIYHKRQLTFMKSEVEIVDTLKGKAPGTAVALFHFDHSIGKPELKNNKIQVTESITVIFDNHRDIEILTYHQSLGFNKHKKAYLAKVSLQKELTIQIVFR